MSCAVQPAGWRECEVRQSGPRSDDPNLVSCAGLEPVMRLAQQTGLHAAVTDRVCVPTDEGANSAGKVATFVAGMLAGADSIDVLDIARHGGVGPLFSSVYATLTLGSFLRTFTHGHVRQLQAAARDTLIGSSASAAVVDMVFTAAEMPEAQGGQDVNFEQEGRLAYLLRSA
jgi:hypothetical protein